jgi:hypothetical protein
MPRLRFADALKFAVFKHAQELRLQVEGKLADFVEEQRAVRGILEIAGARAAGAGETRPCCGRTAWLPRGWAKSRRS